MERIEKLKLVMWDMDGTILDSRKQHYESSKNVLHDHGFELPKDFIKDFFGQTAIQIFSEILGSSVNSVSSDKFREILEERDIAYRELISQEAEFLPGVKQWLEEFHQMGKTQVIVSSTALGNIETVLRVLNAEKYFTQLFSGEHMPSKPDPEVFLMALSKFEYGPEECLIIEDSPHGIQAAKTLGIKCIAAAITFPPEQLSDADLVLENLEQLQFSHINELFPEG